MYESNLLFFVAITETTTVASYLYVKSLLVIRQGNSRIVITNPGQGLN